MKLVDVKPSTYVDYCKENNEKYTKFELGDHVRISYKKYFAKCCIFKLVRRRFCDYKSSKYCAVLICY